MDWQRVDKAVKWLSTLEPEIAQKQISDLRTTDPDIANAVEKFVRRERRMDEFLSTSAPEYVRVIDTLKPGALLGIWELETPLGRGGMGAVYKARRADGIYAQVAAIKVVQVETDIQRKRFDQERQRLARLEHPGIARIIDGGLAEGENNLAYLVMEFIDGRPLDEWVRNHIASLKDVLKLLLSVAQAVSHIHSRLTLHKDLKPANILVSDNAQTKIIDFGIGSDIDDSQPGSSGMTLAFAAPEQLNSGMADAASDIFALGITLYQLLTGELPQRMADGGVVIDSTRIDDPETAAIIRKATSTSLESRYRTSHELIEDIQNRLHSKPVLAYSANRLYKFRKFISRHPLSMALGAGFLIALIGGTAASLISANKAQTALAKAEQALERERIANASREAFTDTLMRLFNEQVDDEDITEILVGYAEQAVAYKETDPTQAAMTAFAVGRSMIFRSDYTRAKEVLEPWIEAGYGPESLIWQGKVDLAYTYNYLSQWDDAQTLFRSARDYFRKNPDFPMYEQVITAEQIARVTRTEEDLEAAIYLAKKALSQNPEDNERAYYYNAIELTYTRMGNFEKAAEFARHNLEFAMQNPLLNRHRLVTSRINVASFDIHLKQDYEEARTLIEANLNDPEISPQRKALTLGLLGELEREKGNLDAALAAFQAALEIHDKVGGKNSSNSVGTRANLAEIALMASDFVTAKQYFDEIEAMFDAGNAAWNPSYILAYAQYLLLTEDQSAVVEFLKAWEFEPSMMGWTLYGLHRKNRLIALGLNFEDLEKEYASH